MELSKGENRSAFAQAIDRRDGAMRDMLGMGSDPISHVEDEPQVVIWRIAGNGDRPRADKAATGAQRQEGRPIKRSPTAVSGVWLFLLSSLAKRNGLLSLNLRSRRK
jgi:hypothetical protein